MKIQVEAQDDHIKRLTSANPVRALGELVWNALDADANNVEVILVPGFADTIEEIRVKDDGLGMTFEDAREGFGRLGGSWKVSKDRTPTQKRLLHGREGKGRFRAFALGSIVEWQSTARSNDSVRGIKVTGDISSIREFDLTGPLDVQDLRTGTLVRISNTPNHLSSLRSPAVRQSLIELLAPYLAKYPKIRVVYDDVRLDLNAVTEGQPEDLALEPIKLTTGDEIEAELTVRQWKFPNERRLALCDMQGFTLCEIPAGIRAPGFNFTAYLRSEYLERRHECGLLEMTEWQGEDEGILKLLGAARKSLGSYFRERQAQRPSELLDEWKKEEIYPFKASPEHPVEIAERQVFDIVAMNVNQYLPGFIEMETRARKFIFECLKVALDTGEENARKIVGEVLHLPKNRQEELLELINKTSLVSVIEASKVVSNRLELLAGLRAMVFDTDLRKITKERSQLHRLLAENSWVFGEEFNLSVDDQSLNEVLARHQELKGEKPSGKKVKRADGTRGIVDLMLSRRVPLPSLHKREHLVIELKAPGIVIGKKEIDQIESYAKAVARDPEFRDVGTLWNFILISTGLNEDAEDKRTQNGLPHHSTYSRENITIWVKTWGEIINDSQSRLQFFQERLSYFPTQMQGLESLRKYYSKYIPSVGQSPGETKPSPGGVNPIQGPANEGESSEI